MIIRAIRGVPWRRCAKTKLRKKLQELDRRIYEPTIAFVSEPPKNTD